MAAGIASDTGFQLADGNGATSLEQSATILAYVGAHTPAHLWQRAGSGKDFGSANEVALADEPKGLWYIIASWTPEHTRLRFGALNTAFRFGHAVLFAVAEDRLFKI
jgi:hypothetical protein